MTSADDVAEARARRSSSDRTAMLGQLTHGRSSCRAYLPDAVPRDKIVQMLEIAQSAASWCNTQPWNVIVTEGDGTERYRNALYNYASRENANDGPDIPFPQEYLGIYKERRRDVGWQLYESVGIVPGDRAASGTQALENFRLFGAPHALILTSERVLGTYGVLDCGIYLGNILLAAEALGLGIVPQAALASYGHFTRRHFGIPDNRIIVAGCSFGFADTGAPVNAFKAGRADLLDTVSWLSD